jgi:hypothetical protein
MSPFPDLNPLNGEDVTELVDLEVNRQDGVKTPASGIPFLVMKAVSRGKVDETPDIEGADNVICLLASLIASEASELAAGNLGETSDISLLMEAMSLMKWFREGEAAGAEAAGLMKSAAGRGLSPEDRKSLVAEGKALIAKTTKESGVANPPVEPAQKDTATPETAETSETPEVTGDVDVLKAIDEKMAAFMAEVQKAAEERTKALADELAVLKATPIPGVVSLTAPPAARAAKNEEDLVFKAAYHDRQAQLVSDRDLVNYHKRKAAEARAAITA